MRPSGASADVRAQSSHRLRRFAARRRLRHVAGAQCARARLQRSWPDLPARLELAAFRVRPELSAPDSWPSWWFRPPHSHFGRASPVSSA